MAERWECTRKKLFEVASMGRRPMAIDTVLDRDVALYRKAGHTIHEVMEKFGISKPTMYAMIARAEELRQMDPPKIEKAFSTSSGNMVLPEGSGGRWSCLFFSLSQRFVGGCEFTLRPNWFDMLAAAKFYGFACLDFLDTRTDGRTTDGEIFGTRDGSLCGYFELTRETDEKPSIMELMR